MESSDYDNFISTLRRPESSFLKEKLGFFINQFRAAAKTANLATQRKQISGFLIEIVKDHLEIMNRNIPEKEEEKLVDLEGPASDIQQEGPASDIQQDKESDKKPLDPTSILLGEDQIKEGWEKLLMSKLFDLTFGAPQTDEKRSNFVLSKKVETYSWIEERHLELNISFNLSLEIAQAELLRINGFRSPRDKLIVLQNVLQLIVDLIKKKAPTTAITTDALLPTLILVILRANPSNLISNIKYIVRYRNAKDMESGSNQFCMTNFMGAISFIYNMDAKSLTLNEEEKTRLGGNSPSFFKQSLGPTTSTSSSSSSPRENVNNFANQITGFFGNFMKEVKTTADELIKEVTPNNNAPPQSPSRLFAPETATSPTFPPNFSSQKPNNSALKLEGVSDEEVEARKREAANRERERYELELAIAMSLSEIQDKKNVSNPETYSPITPTAPSSSVLKDDEEEEPLKRNK